MNPAGSSAFPASTLLARRSLVQGIPFQGMRPTPFDAKQVAAIAEMGTGYPVSKSDFANALRAQQMQMAQDLRELGFHEAADQTEERLGLAVARSQREH